MLSFCLWPVHRADGQKVNVFRLLSTCATSSGRAVRVLFQMSLIAVDIAYEAVKGGKHLSEGLRAVALSTDGNSFRETWIVTSSQSVECLKLCGNCLQLVELQVP